MKTSCIAVRLMVLALLALPLVPVPVEARRMASPEEAHPVLLEEAGPRLLEASSDPSAGVVTLDFDSYVNGTRIYDQYASDGVHVVNDYMPGQPYRASATITAHANARSAPNVLLNEPSCQSCEFHNSRDVPMVIWFDQPMTGVGMWLGAKEYATGGTWCQSVSATVSVYDCNGSLLGQKSVTASSTSTTPVEILDPLQRVQQVVIDFGATNCMETIDDLAFQAGTGVCTDSSPPKVNITSHVNHETVPTSEVTIAGTVQDNGGTILSLRMNGYPLQYHPISSGHGKIYEFSGPATLHGGSNVFTVLAYDGGGNAGSDAVTLNLEIPSTTSLGQFHLTQRGVMENKACDVDKPLVAGKSTIIRIYLQVKTAAGADTYVSHVELKVYRKGQTAPVGTFWGTGTSPFLNTFHSANHMTGIHFWIPGQTFDTEGEYRFEFQPYVGLNKIKAPLVGNCAGTYLLFAETKPIRLYVVPVEAGLSNPNHDPGHVQDALGQLATVARTFPVRDGFSEVWTGQKVGVYYTEANPLTQCDGSVAMENSADWCEGNGWTWRLTDKNPSGTLRRADHQIVLDSSPNAPPVAPAPNICGGGNDTIHHSLGGRMTSDVQTDVAHTLTFNSTMGLMRWGAHPGDKSKYYIPIDEDHDGNLLGDTDDLQRFVAEFYNAQTSSWSTNLALFDQGETFRFFRDQAPFTHCQERDENRALVEPQAPVVTLWENQGKVAYGVAPKLMEEYNKQIPGTLNDASFASLWYPTVVNPQRSDFGSWGPGSSQGKGNWMRVMNDQTLAHELGHNIGGKPVGDLYSSTACQRPATMEIPWVAFSHFQPITPAQVLGVMACSTNQPERHIFTSGHYSTLYKNLRVTSSASALDVGSSQTDQQFVVSGRIDHEARTVQARTSLGSGLEPTVSAPESRYALVFGSGDAQLGEFPFDLNENINPPQGSDDWPLPFDTFHVVAPLPAGSQWVELRANGQPLERYERSSTAPVVELLAPNGGEGFDAREELLVRWSSEDMDSHELVHTLYYSPDGGERWIVVGSGLTGSEFLWKLSDTPGTADSSGLLRIVASDGFNTGEDQSDGSFQIVGKPPMVVILAPQPDSTFLQCERLHLDGVALDPEGRLEHAFWTLDGLDLDAQLTEQIEPLEPGTHHLVLTAIDEQELVATDELNLTVLADSDCDGMSNGFEETHGLDPGFVEDAAWDLDEDGLPSLDEAWYGTSPVDSDTDGDGYPDDEEIRLGSDPTRAEDTPARVYVSPAQESLGIADTVTVDLRVDNVHNLYAAQVEMAFNPQVVEVVDAYEFSPGVQIEEGDFPVPEVVVRNQADNGGGTLQYAVSLLGAQPGLSGSGTLARITLRGLRAGESPLAFSNIVLSDPQSVQIAVPGEGGLLTIEEAMGTVSGRVILERRPGNGGSIVCVDAECANVAGDGSFAIGNVPPGPHSVAVSRDSYLRSWREVDVPVGLLTLPDVTLLGGDVNGDDHIEGFDAISAGLAWNSTPMDAQWDQRADITDDGSVNILDMVAVQFNWDAMAPGPWDSALAQRGQRAPEWRALPERIAATQVMISPSQATLSGAGETVDMDIRVEDVADLYGGRVQITFDPSIIRVLDADPRGSAPGVQIRPGDFLDPFNQFVLVNEADNVAGTIDFAVTQLYPAEAQSGSGVLATVQFEGVGGGSSAVHLADVRLGDDTRPDPQEIPAGTLDGLVTVGAQHTVWLPIAIVP